MLRREGADWDWRQAREKYEAKMMDTIFDAVVFADSEKSIVDFNNAAEGLWDIKKSDAKGMCIEELFYRGKELQYLDRIIDETKVKGYHKGEFLFSRKNGTTFYGLLSTALAVDENGKEGILVVVRDLSTEKRLQDQLLQFQKFPPIGRFIEAFAHEIRNPLVSIGGFAKKIDAQTEESFLYKKYLQAIIKDAGRLEKMLNEMERYLEFAKVHKTAFGRADLVELLRDVVDKFNDTLSMSNISLFFSVAGSIPMIYINNMYIRELFSTIIGNAIEDMPHGGNLFINLSQEGNLLITSISDTGTGVAGEHLDEMFEPFVRSKTGMISFGLTKCYAIVLEHNGVIRVGTAPGKGTVFSIGLPIERRQRVMVPS